MIGIAVLTCIYVVLGGYMATAVNDLIQGIVMLFGIVLVIAAVLANNGRVYRCYRPAGASSVEAVCRAAGAYANFFGPDPLSLLGVVLLTSLGTTDYRRWYTKFLCHQERRLLIPRYHHFHLLHPDPLATAGCTSLVVSPVSMILLLIYDAAGNIVYGSMIPTMLSTLPDNA